MPEFDPLARPPENGSYVEIDTARFSDNIRAIRSALTSPTDLICVVKADAYGHGIHPMVRAAFQAGARRFAVAYVHEAEAVRFAAPEAELILVIGVTAASEVARMVQHHITPIVVSLDHAKELSTAAQSLSVTLPIHLKLDTGMGRLGFVCPSDESVAMDVFRLPGLKVQGVCTHFATVEPIHRPEAATGQVQRFFQTVENLEQLAGRHLFRHASSSRAALLLPEYDFDAVRIGIALFGYGAGDERLRFVTKPVLQWKTRILQVKTVPTDFPVGYYSAFVTTEPTDIATLSVGYADGYPRHLSNKGIVLVGGRRCQVVGRISMNWITVDLGLNSGVQPGDEAVLLGHQNEESFWADEFTKLYGTISYEILTGISARLPRIYPSYF